MKTKEEQWLTLEEKMDCSETSIGMKYASLSLSLSVSLSLSLYIYLFACYEFGAMSIFYFCIQNYAYNLLNSKYIKY